MAKTRDYMDYLDDNIEIAPANSQEEYAAADTIAQVLQDHELETSIEEFDAHPLGKLVKPILTCVLLILFVIALLTEGAPHVIMLLLMAAIVAVPLVEHFMGVKLFENFGPASRSQNVVAVHRATGDKVVKGARPIVIVAHYDTPHESLLYKQPLARYQSTLRAVTVPCYIAIAVSVFFQILLFLPPVLRTVAWVVGLIALLPVLAISVMDVISHFANSTLGSNDNKSGVAALLAIANKVRPMPDRVSDDFEETDHKPARRRAADDSVEPAAPKYVEIVEEVKGVRHGADVLNALGILPVSCEVVYKEPRVQVVEQMDTDVITAGDEDEAKKSSESNGAAAAAVAVAGAVAAVAAADEEKPLDEEAEPAEKSLDEDVPSIDEEAQDSHEDDDYDENAGDEDLYDDEADYDDEEEFDDEADYDEDVDYDEDEEWEDSSIATVGAWLKDRFSGIREFFSKDKGSDIEIDKGEDRRDANAESDEYDEWIDDTYDEDADAEYEEAEFVEEFDDQDHEVVDYDDEDTEDELDDEYEYEEELEYEDELDEELDEDETYEVIDDLGEDMLEEELLEEDEAEVEGEAEAEVEDEVPAYEGYDENILEEEAYEDALLANEDFDDDVYEEELLEEDEELIEDEVTEDEYVEEEYVDEDVYEEDESEEVYEVEDEVDEYVDFEYDDDEEAYEDEEVYEDEEAYEDEAEEDEYEEVYEEQDQPSGIGARIARFFSRIRGNGEPADDAYGAEDLFDQAYDGEEEEEVYEQYESYEEDDEYEEYEEYEDADDETYEEEEPLEQIEDDDEYEYVEEYVDEDLDEDGEVYEYVEDEEAFEEVEQDEDGFVDADLEFDDEVEYQSEPVRRAEELLDPNRLHFDREEDPNIPRDTTGLDMISDSYDLYSGEVNRAASREKPEPLEDSSWGVSSYQPARPAMNIARRAALFDLPDPSFASIDPFEDDEYEDYDDEYDEGEEIVSDELDYDEPEAYEPEPAPEPDAPDTFEDEEEAYYEDEVEEPTNRAQDNNNNNFWGSNRNTNWKGGATVRSDLRDDDLDDPLIIDADDLQDAILELGDDFLVAHDIWFVATGASEANHAGIRAFIDEHRRDIRGAFLINLDSIGAGELSLLTREGLQSPRRADRRLVRMLDDIARDLHIGLKTTTYNFDERESATSMRSRVRSVTIAGLDENGLPAYSHTTDDVPENVDPKQVSDVVRIVTELIRRS